MNIEELAQDLREMKRRNGTWTKYWEPFMQKYDCQYICELGVAKGANFHEMIRHSPKLAVAIDSWIDDGHLSRNDGKYLQEELNIQYEDFIASVSGKPFVKVYRDYTFNVVKHFPDNFFDLVYIDADHSYEGCLRDIEDWYPKVKKGRFLIGDDYRVYEGKHTDVKFGVIEAVNDFVKKNSLEFFPVRRYGWAIVKK
jgi:hypothetical protein